MKSPWLVAVLLAALPGPASTQDAGSRVTVPLAEYEALKKGQERASVTVVDALRLGGSFKGRDLDITFSGRSAGSLPAIDVLANVAGIVVFGCDGDGIVSRGEAGVFRLTPLAGRFVVKCRLATRGSDRLEMWSTPAVLWVEANVADGEFVLGAEEADGRRQFSVVRRVAAVADGPALKPSATGRYKITLRPDEARFLYQIEVHNPNRARQSFDVAMLSGEQVQQVDAPVSYDVLTSHYRFDIPPGDTTIKLSGSLAGSSFKPPIEASVQYCLLESHPLLRSDTVRAPKRVSPQEVGIAAEYRGAQAFIIGPGDALVWKTTKLEALARTSFAVSHVSHVFFLAVDGPALGQSDIAIDNQGASDISLPMTADPTFASLQGDPVLLTKNAEHALWLPMAQGAQALMVQHRQPYGRIPGFGYATLTLPQLPVPASRGEVWLRYPAEWFPIYESFLSEANIWTPDAGMVIAFLLFFVWTERVLAGLGLQSRTPRFVLAAALVLAGLAWGWALLVLIAADIVVSVVVAWPWIRARGLAGGIGILLAIGIVFVFILAISIPSLLRSRSASSPSYSEEYRQSAPSAMAPASPERKAEQAQAEPAQYQGLPAKFEMPRGVHHTHFSRELLDTEKPRAARVVMVSQTLLGWLQALIVLVALLLVWRVRATLLAGWRSRLAALRPPPDPAPAA
jgi:hypothetical protein